MVQTVSDSRTLSTSSQTATLKLTNALVVKAGTSVMLDVLVSLNGQREQPAPICSYCGKCS